jgi:hypothetical protein
VFLSKVSAVKPSIVFAYLGSFLPTGPVGMAGRKFSIFQLKDFFQTRQKPALKLWSFDLFVFHVDDDFSRAFLYS